MSWREDVSEDLPTFAPSCLNPDDVDDMSMSVRMMDDGAMQETSEGEATVFEVVPLSVPDGATDMNGDQIEEGERYQLMTSSNRLLYALSEHADNLTEEEVTIRAQGAKNSYDRTYTVSSY